MLDKPEKIKRDKRSSLFRRDVSGGEKKFCEIEIKAESEESFVRRGTCTIKLFIII